MNDPIFKPAAALFDGLGKGGVGMDGPGDILHPDTIGGRNGQLVDQLRGLSADDMGAQDLSGAVRQDLHHTLALSNGNGFADGTEGEGIDLCAGSLRLGGGDAEACHLGLTVDAVGHIGLFGLVSDPGHVLHGHLTLVGGHMSQHGRGDHIADGIDARASGLKVLVDGNEAPLCGNAQILQADACRVGRSAHHSQDLVHRNGFLHALGVFDLHCDLRLPGR